MNHNLISWSEQYLPPIVEILVLYSTLLDKTDIVLYNISMINFPINKLLGFGKLIRNKWLYKAKISRRKFMGVEEFPAAPSHFKVLQMAVLSRL